MMRHLNLEEVLLQGALQVPKRIIANTKASLQNCLHLIHCCPQKLTWTWRVSTRDRNYKTLSQSCCHDAWCRNHGNVAPRQLDAQLYSSAEMGPCLEQDQLDSLQWTPFVHTPLDSTNWHPFALAQHQHASICASTAPTWNHFCLYSHALACNRKQVYTKTSPQSSMWSTHCCPCPMWSTHVAHEFVYCEEGLSQKALPEESRICLKGLQLFWKGGRRETIPNV